MNTIVVQIADSPLERDRTALKDVCGLRAWCHEHIKNGWCSYFLNTSDENRLQGIGFVAFDFENPKEAMKFQLWTGA